MNQQKYITYAILLIVVGAAIFFGIKKISQGKDVVNSSNNIAYDNPVDSTHLDGKRIFQSNCVACHNIFKDATGPALLNVTKRWPNRKKLYQYIRNPIVFEQTNEYAKRLRKKYGGAHPIYLLTDKEIDSIFDYIEAESKKKGVPIP